MEIKRITAGCWKGWGRGEVVQGFVERHVQVNGTGTSARAAVEGEAHREARTSRQFGEVHARPIEHVMVHRVRRVHARLGNRLAVTSSHHVSRSVGRDAQQRNAGVERLGQGWSVIEGSCSRSANGRNGGPRGQCKAEGVVRRRSFVNAHVHSEFRLVVQCKDKRRVT